MRYRDKTQAAQSKSQKIMAKKALFLVTFFLLKSGLYPL